MASGNAAKYVDTSEQAKAATQSRVLLSQDPATMAHGPDVKVEAVKSPLKVEVGMESDSSDELYRKQASNAVWIVLEILSLSLAGLCLGGGFWAGANSGDGWADGRWKFALAGLCFFLILFGLMVANHRRAFGKVTSTFRQGCGLCNGSRIFMLLFLLTGGVTFIVNALSQKDEGCVRSFCPDHVLDVKLCPAFTWNKHCAKTAITEKYEAAVHEDCAELGMSECGGTVTPNCSWISTTCAKPVIDPDQNGVRIVSRIFGILTGLVFSAWLLASWESFRYNFGNSVMAHAFAYMSVVGWVVLTLARWLVPVSERVQKSQFKWTWHQYQPLHKIFGRTVQITLLCFFFFIIMGGMVVAGYADLSRASLFGEQGSPALAIVLYVIFANVIGVLPLAPGSAIDVMGGFLFTLIFVEYYSWSLPLSWIVTLAIVIALHFMSSCIQYFMGRTKAAQKWMNHIAPVDMLTASETVLKEAGCIKVGIVGQVFMDTMGGLNQGRMNMNFCTQFWSEYASIPNGIALVTFGAILALPMLDRSVAGQWQVLGDFLPIVIMVATVFQSAGATYGLGSLMASARSIKEYWMVTEKWTAAQWFMRRGIYATEKGWAEDVYRIGYGADCPVEHSVWSKCYAKHAMERIQYDEAQEAMALDPLKADPVALLVTQRKTEAELEKIREQHYEQVFRAISDVRLSAKPGFEDLIVVQEPDSESVSFFQYDQDQFGWVVFHFLFCVIYFGLFLSTYYNLLAVEGVGLDSAVEKGLSVLPSLQGAPIGWSSFILFWAFTFFHYHRELWGQLGGCASCLTCCCRKTDPLAAQMETEFDIRRANMHEWLDKNADHLEQRLKAAQKTAAEEDKLDT